MNETTKIFEWADNGNKLITKHYRYDLGADDLEAIVKKYPLFAAVDPNAVFDLVNLVYAAGIYRGHNMGKREAARNAKG